MKFHIQGRYCLGERVSRSPEPFASLKGKLREGKASLCPSRETLPCAQGDNTLPMLGVKVQNRPLQMPGLVGETDNHPEAKDEGLVCPRIHLTITSRRIPPSSPL